MAADKHRRKLAAGGAVLALTVGIAVAALVLNVPGRPQAQPADPDETTGRPQLGMRAFLDRDAGVLHLRGRSIALAEVPGLSESGLAVRGGVLFQTPDQEVRVIDIAGNQRLLAKALGPPPAGFTPSVAYDSETDVAVALRLTAEAEARGRPLIAAYSAATGDPVKSSQMIQMADATAVTLAGATEGTAAVNFQGAHWTGVLTWSWTTPGTGGEWGRGRVFDLRDRVVLGSDPTNSASRTGWRFVTGRAGERLDPAGEWRVDGTWQPWPSGGPVERSTSGDDVEPLPHLPSGSHLSLSYDTDGSVLAAVAGVAGAEDAVLLFDCDLQAQMCEPIGQVDGATQDPLFLDGATTVQPAGPDIPTGAGTRPLSYGQGQVLHLGDRVLDTEIDFLSLDATDDGAALTTLDGAIWFTDGTDLEQVGAILGGRAVTRSAVTWPAGRPSDWVVNDSSGSMLAWLEYPDGVEKPQLVVYDSSSREVVARQPFEARPRGRQESGAAVAAVAGGEVFVSLHVRSPLDDDLLRYHVGTGVLEPVEPDQEVLEAATRSVPRALVVGSSAETGHVLGHAGVTDAASYYTSLAVADSRIEGLFDPHTGEPVDMDVPGGYEHTSLFFVQWLDDDRFALISFDSPSARSPTGDLLICQIDARRCTVAIESSTWDSHSLYPLIPGDGGAGAELALRQAMIEASTTQGGR